MTTRIFVVNYHFVFCGDVFTDGLRHAAADLGLEYEGAYWNDPELWPKIDRFYPDLLFVVHGRKFAQRFCPQITWVSGSMRYKTAVWLVDEPYEVDDTSQWSPSFDTVFVNDPSTLHRHRNAHYLPMCFDPHVHRDYGNERVHKVGFVGNWSATRERYLRALAAAGLLSYVVGEKWRASALSAYCLAGNVPAQRTAELYQQTEIVVNVFREKHHYNMRRTPATSMNPRIYEALACGAAVVSERRKEISTTFPYLPQFDSPSELVDIAGALLSDRARLTLMRSQCLTALGGHAYRDRLLTVLQTCLASEREAA